VLEEPVRHLLEPEPDVLEADLLCDCDNGHRRMEPVYGAHESREDSSVAHAGVDQPDRRRDGGDLGQFLAGAVGDDRLLVRGVDEREVLLAVVVEAERGRGFRRRRAHLRPDLQRRIAKWIAEW
jgi:hypothetical protein